MNLVRAEFRRLSKRRITRYMLILMLLGCAAVAGGIAASSEHIGPAQRAEAQEQANQQEQRDRQRAETERQACEQSRKTGTPDERFPSDVKCDEITGPPPGTYDMDWYLPYEFDFRKQFGTFVSVFASLLALFAFVVGASYVGAEWSSGGMMNLLLWRPRRLAVLFTKLGVLLGTVLGVGAVFGAAWTATFWAIGRYDGRLGHLTSGVWRSFALDGARGLGLALAAGAIAFGLASLGRHTGMALGAAMAAGVISEIGLRIVMSIMDVTFGDRYVLSTYAISWLMKEYKLTDWSSCDYVAGACEAKEFIVTWQDSAVVLGTGTALILVAAVWLMRRRDIT